MAGFNDLGNLEYTVSANIDKLVADIAVAKSEIESTGSVSEATAARVDAVIGQIGSSLGDLVDRINNVKRSTGDAVDFTAQAWGKAEAAVSEYISTVGVAAAVTNSLPSSMTETAVEAEKAEKTTKGMSEQFSAAAGKAGLAVAAVAGIVKAYGAVRDYIKNGETLATLFELQQGDKSPESRLEAINAKLQDVNAELGRAQRNPLNPLGRRVGQIKEEIEALRDLQLSTSQQVKAARIQDAKDVAAAEIEAAESVQQEFRKRLQTSNRDAEIDLLPSEQQIGARADVMRNELVKAAKEANIDIHDQDLQLALDNINNKAQREIEKNREVARIKEEAEIKAAEKAAMAFAKTIEREFKTIADGLNGSTVTFTARLDTIVKELKYISSVGGRGH